MLIHGWPQLIFIYLACASALMLSICVKIVRDYELYLQSITQNNDALSMMEDGNNAWSNSERVHYTPDSQFSTIAENIARVAIRSLPPVKSFDGDEKKDCSICMEEFEKGELIQPFGVCAHEFHIKCLTSWLRGGKTTCPGCRHDLSIKMTSTFVL